MTISVLLDPAKLPSRTMDQTAFDAAMAYLMSNIPTLGAQINATEANLNSIAAGGAFALKYTVGANPGAGVLVFQLASQSGSPLWYLGEADSTGVTITAILDSLFGSGASTSGIKAGVRIVKLADPTKWIQASVTSQPSTYSGYRALAVTVIAASATSPFAAGEAVVLQVTRNGDAGVAPSSMRVQDQKAGGTVGGASTGGTVHTRTLNTVVKNTIPGATLSGNQITLPAGKYKVTGSAPCYGGQGHIAYLYNVTTGATLVSGTSEYAAYYTTNSIYGASRSLVVGEFTLTAAAVIELRHYIAITQTAGLGNAASASAGQTAVFSELNIELAA